MAEPRWQSFGRFSGPWIGGTTIIPPPSSLLTADRQHWLTTRVETGATFGTVVMFDGTTVTAAPDQFILTYPAELANEDFNAADDQGLLGKLLARLFALPDPGIQPAANALKTAFAAAGWYLSPLGELRYLTDHSVALVGRKIQVKAGDLVHGAVLRDTITPVGGAVPQTGPAWEQSAQWCRLFAALFSSSAGFAVQDAYGRERLLKMYKAPRKQTLAPCVELAVFGKDLSSVRVTECGPALDLAMAVWYSNSVNAPAIALTCLQQAIVGGAHRPDFPARLLRALGSSNFGRWNAKDPNGRYQRTRRLAIASSLWPPSLFEGPSAIMPVRLEGAVA